MEHQASKLAHLANIKHQNNRVKSAIKFITISSGKGGVGKSTIVANLGFVLAQSGLKTIILDADIGLANLDIILNKQVDKNILHVLKGEALLQDVIIKIAENLSLIPSDSGEDILQYAKSMMLEPFLQEMNTLNTYDLMLIDTGAGIGNHVFPFIDAADYPIVVLTPDPTSITDAYAMIKSIAKRQNNIYLIVNQVKSRVESEAIFNKIAKVSKDKIDPSLNLHLLGHLHHDKIVTNSIRKRTLFIENSPLSIPTIDIRKITTTLTGKMEHNLIDNSPNKVQYFFNKVLSALKF